MKARRLLCVSIGSLLLCGQALAVKISAQVSPKSAASQGFTVTTAAREDGTVRFTVVRDLSKARWHGRDATLEVRGDAGLQLRCRLEPEKSRRKNTVTYWFDLTRERIPQSTLTIAETQTADNDAESVKLIGGGTYYEFLLAEFARP
jgi:hypothetical protein